MGSKGKGEQGGLVQPGSLEEDEQGLTARGGDIPSVNEEDKDEKLLHELSCHLHIVYAKQKSHK